VSNGDDPFGFPDENYDYTDQEIYDEDLFDEEDSESDTWTLYENDFDPYSDSITMTRDAWIEFLAEHGSGAYGYSNLDIMYAMDDDDFLSEEDWDYWRELYG
jgi:hypothetical protein